MSEEGSIHRARRGGPAFQGTAPLDLTGSIQLAVLSRKEKVARCRLLGAEQGA